MAGLWRLMGTMSITKMPNGTYWYRIYYNIGSESYLALIWLLETFMLLSFIVMSFSALICFMVHHSPLLEHLKRQLQQRPLLLA